MDHNYRKRKRTVLTAKQHKILNKFFEECAFPDSEQRLSLGKALNMTPRTVQIWFQNQRQKIRNHCDDQRFLLASEEEQVLDSLPEQSNSQHHCKSLNVLANAACIEYYRKFGDRSQKDSQDKL